MLSSVQYASIKTFISTELNNNHSLSNNDSISSLLQSKHNAVQDNEKKLKLSYDFSNLLTCPKQSKPVKINIGNIKQPYPNSYRTVKQQHTSTSNHNSKDIHSLYTIIKPNHNNNNNNKKCAHSKESKTQSNSKSTSRDKSNHKANYNSCNYNYNYIHHHNQQLCSSDNHNIIKMNSNVITSYNNKKHTSNTLKQTFSDNSGGPLLNEKLFSKLNLKPYTTSTSNNSNSNNMNTPSSIVNTTTSIIKTKDNKKHDNTSINLNIYCNNNITNNNIKNVHIKQINNTTSKTKKANSNTSHSNSNTNRSHYHSSINSYRSNRLGKKSNANINLTSTNNNNYISTTATISKHKCSKQNATYLIPKKKISKKKLNKSKQEHTIVVNYNNGQLPLMIINKKNKERICKESERVTTNNKHKHESYEVIEHIREEYIDLSEPEELKHKINEHKDNDNECNKNEHIVVASSSSTQVVKEDKRVSRKSSSKHSRDQNTKSNNKNAKNEEIMKQIKNSLDDNLKVMFNFSYENFLSKESETESKKSSEQEILITESYEA